MAEIVGEYPARDFRQDRRLMGARLFTFSLAAGFAPTGSFRESTVSTPTLYGPALITEALFDGSTVLTSFEIFLEGPDITNQLWSSSNIDGQNSLVEMIARNTPPDI